jgi:protein-disulfide isomerase
MILKTIHRKELKEKLARGDDFALVMTLGEDDFHRGHIPGSINISSMEQARGQVSPEDEIIVYCHDVNCPASKAAYHMLVSHGFTRVIRYAGGIRDWEQAGYPIERDIESGERVALPTSLSQPVTDEDHVRGRLGASVMVVVYGDYECPYTRRTMAHVKGLQRRFGDDLCFAYRHYPAPAELHPHAWIAAEAALSARTQARFWEMHDALFMHQKALEYDNLVRYAADLGLADAAFKNEMIEHVHNPRIERDRQSGWNSGASDVPTLFINDVRYEGDLTLAAVIDVIDNA